MYVIQYRFLPPGPKEGNSAKEGPQIAGVRERRTVTEGREPDRRGGGRELLGRWGNVDRWIGRGGGGRGMGRNRLGLDGFSFPAQSKTDVAPPVA